MKRELTHGSLFSGIEGFGLGAALAGIKTEWSCEFEKYQTEVIKKILEMDTQYMEILERLKTRHLLTSSAVDSLAKTSALLEKYIERLANFYGNKLEVVGYSHKQLTDEPLLIVDASKTDGWPASELKPSDVIFKDCETYWYIDINDLID